MVRAGKGVHAALLETVRALEFDVWCHGDLDVVVCERPAELAE